ncbi:MAG: hypothetical protein R3A44_00155 [Caldilineaceae bacterium]
MVAAHGGGQFPRCIGNEGRGDGFEIPFEFSHSDIASQMLFVNPFKRTQEVARIGPKTFGGIDMDLANAIAIIVAGPFAGTMTNG